MNICFRVIANDNTENAEASFLEKATARGLSGLKGHRSVGGIRASNYNWIPLIGAQRLANFIHSFAQE
ncbi:Phosphoserine transaminase [Parahypoxylon ruwenzoriense]